ncbi:MAG: leucyl aminopeptidase family protein, partial [Pyrinomonadaceae bacterium]
MEIKTSNLGFKEQDVTALVVPVFKDEKLDDELLKNLDNSTGGLIASVLEAKEMTGKEGETAYLHLNGVSKDIKAQRLLLIGAGEKEKYRNPQIAQMAGTAARILRPRNVKSIGIIPRSCHGELGGAASEVVEGVLTALFEIDKYKTVDKEENAEKNIERLVVIVEGFDQGVLDCHAARGKVIGESVNYTRDLANEPSAYLTPTDLADKATVLAKECGLEVDILDETRMEKEGMGSLLCVGKGSEQPSKLIILKYTPEGEGKKKSNDLLAFVGKGVTFDTGGISIKPAEHMDQMKYDMTGGATVLGVMRAISLLKATIPVLGIVPAVENMPSGKAVKPGDVVR